MATNYPGSLDAFVNPASGNTLDSPSHSLQHSDINDAVEALETKLGVGTATPGTATAYFPLVAGTAGATSWTRLTATGITSGTATNGQVLTANGSGAVTFNTPSTPGMVLLNTTSFSAVASQALPASTFTSSYRNYKIILNITALTADASIFLKMRSGGTDASTNYSYGIYGVQGNGTVTSQVANTLTTGFFLNSVDLANPNSLYLTDFTLGAPFLTSQTTFTTTVAGVTTASQVFGMSGGGVHDTSASYDTANIIASAGNITGVISVYGWNA